MKASLCSPADGLKPCWTYYRAGRWVGEGREYYGILTPFPPSSLHPVRRRFLPLMVLMTSTCPWVEGPGLWGQEGAQLRVGLEAV